MNSALDRYIFDKRNVQGNVARLFVHGPAMSQGTPRLRELRLLGVRRDEAWGLSGEEQADEPRGVTNLDGRRPASRSQPRSANHIRPTSLPPLVSLKIPSMSKAFPRSLK